MANVMPTFSWSFTTTVDGFILCAPAAPLTIEILLRGPLPTPALEKYRKSVLSTISGDSMLDHRIRGLVLIAYENDFGPVFREILDIPSTVLEENVCKRRRVYDADRELRVLEPLAAQARRELQQLGLSPQYITMLETRVRSASPQHRVSAACATILFAAVLLMLSLGTIVEEQEVCAPWIPGAEARPFTGAVTLTSNADIAAFAGGNYDAVLGAVTISEASPGAISSLQGLEKLKYISGNLTIATNTAITNLQGIARLARVGGSFTVNNNSALTNITLPLLHNVDGNVNIHDNAVLAILSMDCLDTIGGANGLRLNTNGGALSLAGAFAGLQHVGDGSGTGGIQIHANAGLSSMAGAFPRLLTVDYVELFSNTALTTAAGAFPLVTTMDYLKVQGNSSLTGWGSSTFHAWAASVAPLHSSYIDFNTNGAVNLAGAFHSLNSLSFDYVKVYDQCSSLALAFPALTRASYVEVVGCTSLTTLAGAFGALTSLESLSGGAGNGTDNGYVLIKDNPVLSTMSGAWPVIPQFARLTIDNNDSLGSVGGFAGLTTLASTPASNTTAAGLHLINNAALNNVASLAALTTVSYVVEITQNASLASIATLQNINGANFESVTHPGSRNVTITFNASLPENGEAGKFVRNLQLEGYTGAHDHHDNLFDLPLSPTMWWRLDQPTGDTATVDSSGNNRTATANPTDWSNPGVYFPADSFNGYPYTPASDLTGSSALSHATLSVISTFDNPPTAHHGEVNGGLPNGYAGVATVDPGLGLFLGNLDNVGPNVIFATVIAHDPATYANSLQTTFTAGVRTMWTVTYSGTTLKLYKDGVLVGTRSSTNIDVSNAVVRLANDNYGGAAGGVYEHFITYDRALSDAEVLALYNALGGP
jgi:hypothetical protein